MSKRLTYSERKNRDEMWAKGYLWCTRCETFLYYREFRKNKEKNSNYGYSFHCTECQKREYQKSDHDIKRKLYYQKLKIEAVDLMGGCCQRCGYSGFRSSFDFHHVYPDTKKSTPTQILYRRGIEGAWPELDKCCLLCRNCHAGYTGNEWRAEFVKRDGLGWTVGKDLPLSDSRYDTIPPESIEQATLPLEYQTIQQIKLPCL